MDGKTILEVRQYSLGEIDNIAHSMTPDGWQPARYGASLVYAAKAISAQNVTILKNMFSDFVLESNEVIKYERIQKEVNDD